MTSSEASAVSEYLGTLDAYLQPAERGPLLARILALLCHYRADPQPHAVEVQIADDWAEDLADYPMWAISEAARVWRRTKKFRPQICEIRALCDDAVSALKNERHRLRSILQRQALDHSPFAREALALAGSLFKPSRHQETAGPE